MYFKLKNVEFHSYQLPERRALRVVFRNLHQSTDPEIIKSELESMGFSVRQVVNVYSREKLSLPMFYVDLEPRKDNERIYKLTGLLSCAINVQPFRARNQIPQCSRCQDFNHTSGYCLHRPRCVRCKGEHSYKECPVPRSLPPQCVNCGGQHTANYRGCDVHKLLLKKRAQRRASFQQPVPKLTTEQFPSLRPTTVLQATQNIPTQPLPKTPQNFVRPHATYSAAIKNGNTRSPSNSESPSELISLISTTFNALIQPLLQAITQISHTMSQIQTYLMRNGK